MYFFRYCNQNFQNRENRPSACKTAEIIPRRGPSVALQTVSVGGFLASGFAGTEQRHELLLLNLVIPPQDHCVVNLQFSCGVSLIKSMAEIRFQLLKSGANGSVPLASPVIYSRTSSFSGSDTVTFTACDPNPVERCFISYRIKMYMIARIPQDGMVNVTNPMLTAIYF